MADIIGDFRTEIKGIWLNEIGDINTGEINLILRGEINYGQRIYLTHQKKKNNKLPTLLTNMLKRI